MNAPPEHLIMEWNSIDSVPAPLGRIQVHDETLRDGLQSPSATQPTLGEKLELLSLMNRLGVESVCLGMPVSSPTAKEHVRGLAQGIVADRLSLDATCAARTLPADIAVIADIAHATGLPMWVTAFVGISPIRMYVEQWSPESVMRNVQDAVAFARQEGLRVCIVTEDTTRSRPEVTLDVYAAALHAGAERICICDTVGYATPWSAAAVVTRMRNGLADLGFPEVGIDWHGHNDRGLALANSLAAACAGADRLHGTALGIGERAGNAPTEQLIANLCNLGWRTGDLSLLPRYCDLAARSCGVDVPGNQPIVGADVFRTAAGVHAAAIRKAQRLGDIWLAERVYAGIPASTLGRNQTINVGPGSGASNILNWLQSRDIPEDPLLVQEIQQAVADASRVLSDQELLGLVAGSRFAHGSA
jgi:isopropylmalate/homocitrate/citramalate synthase